MAGFKRTERRAPRTSTRRPGTGSPRAKRSTGGPRTRRSDSPRGESRESRGRNEDYRSRSDNFRSRSEPKRFNMGRRDVEMTKVTCDECGVKCEVPFKPTSNKPIYCKGCFGGKEDGFDRGSDRPRTPKPSIPSAELDTINEKLNKIMKALKID